MGYSFANIQLRRPVYFKVTDVPSIVDMLMEDYHLQPVSSAKEAEVTTVVYCPPESSWISLYSDVLDGDPAALIFPWAGRTPGAPISGPGRAK